MKEVKYTNTESQSNEFKKCSQEMCLLCFFMLLVMHRSHRWENGFSSDVSEIVYAAIFNGLT
jgi:hypothetical protein